MYSAKVPGYLEPDFTSVIEDAATIASIDEPEVQPDILCIDISNPEAIRRIVREAATLASIKEVVGFPLDCLGTSNLPLSVVEKQTVNGIQKLWLLSKEAQRYILSLIQACGQQNSNHPVVKAAKRLRICCGKLVWNRYEEMEAYYSNGGKDVATESAPVTSQGLKHPRRGSNNGIRVEQDEMQNQGKENRDGTSSNTEMDDVNKVNYMAKKRNLRCQKNAKAVLPQKRYLHNLKGREVATKSNGTVLNISKIKKTSVDSSDGMVKELEPYNNPGTTEKKPIGKKRERRPRQLNPDMIYFHDENNDENNEFGIEDVLEIVENRDEGYMYNPHRPDGRSDGSISPDDEKKKNRKVNSAFQDSGIDAENDQLSVADSHGQEVGQDNDSDSDDIIPAVSKNRRHRQVRIKA
ncbi:hypothetical protein NHQ30_007871 [Ciborinia camelliae]|nr:hypothetical protein NHQ30_007871 [Ciborinia camelliae]